MSMNTLVLWCLILFFAYFIVSYILSKTMHSEPMYDRGESGALQQPAYGKENPYQQMEISIDTLNGEVEKLNKKLSGFDARITDMESQIHNAVSMAQNAQNTANDANNKVSDLTKAMSGGK